MTGRSNHVQLSQLTLDSSAPCPGQQAQPNLGYRQQEPPLYPIDSFSQPNQGYPSLANQEPSSHVPGLSIQPNSGYPSQPNVGPYDQPLDQRVSFGVNPNPPPHPTGNASHPWILNSREDFERQVLEFTQAATTQKCSLAAMCHCPNVSLPPWYKIPQFAKFDGKGDPHHHLRLFISDTLPVRDNKDNLIFLFQKSFEGDAARWFGSLPVGSITSFEDLATNFLNQYSYLTGKKPTIADLQDTAQRPEEDLKAFFSRFREVLIKTEIPLPESQAVQMLVKNLRDPLRSLIRPVTVPILIFMKEPLNSRGI